MEKVSGSFNVEDLNIRADILFDESGLQLFIEQAAVDWIERSMEYDYFSHEFSVFNGDNTTKLNIDFRLGKSKGKPIFRFSIVDMLADAANGLHDVDDPRIQQLKRITREMRENSRMIDSMVDLIVSRMDE